MTSLSLILPCYNEAERLPATLAAFLSHLPSTPGTVEVVVVDDGSSDGTAAVADAIAAADPRVRVLRSTPNQGKGFAVRAGMLAAAGELVVFTDADGSYGPDEVDRVVRALAEAPVAIGVRPPATATNRFARSLASQVFNRLLRALLGLPFHDTQCGLKGFHQQAARAVFGRARVDGFAFDVEVLVLARRLGLAVAQVPVQAQQRAGSTVHLLGDSRRMLSEVWALRTTATTDHDEVLEPASPPSSATATTAPAQSTSGAGASLPLGGPPLSP
jgi:glycosyltransferase involved in cell wall biosynthesis